MRPRTAAGCYFELRESPSTLNGSKVVQGLSLEEILPDKVDVGPIEIRAKDSKGQSVWVVAGYDTKENVELTSGVVNLAHAGEGTHIRRYDSQCS